MPDENTVPRPRKRAPRNMTPKTETTETTESHDSGGPGLFDSTEMPRKRTPADAKLAESVKGMYEGIGLLALGAGMHRSDDRLIGLGAGLMQASPTSTDPMGNPVYADPRTGADKLTDAWMTLADRNPRVKTALKKFAEGGAVAELAAMHFSMLLPFLPGIPGLSFLSTHKTEPDTAYNGTIPTI